MSTGPDGGAAAIDAVIFDIGNVLIRWDPRHLYRRMGYADAETDRIIAETGLIEMNLEFDRGLPFAHGLAELSRRHPQHASFIDAWNHRWTDMLDGAIDANVALLASAKAARLPVYAISNFSREKFDVARKIFPFLETFDDVVVSADVGLLKPDPAIYKVLLDRQAIDPTRSVFIDDSAKNVAAAAALGMRTVHYASESLVVSRQLERLGLRF